MSRQIYEWREATPSLWFDPALSAAPALIVFTSGLRHSFFAIEDPFSLNPSQERLYLRLAPSPSRKRFKPLVRDRNQPFCDKIFEQLCHVRTAQLLRHVIFSHESVT